MEEPSPLPRSIPGNRLGQEIPSGRLTNINHMLRAEFRVLHLRVYLAELLVALIPIYVGGSIRAKVLSWLGFNIGDGTVMWGMPKITGRGSLTKQLSVGRDCWFNIGCFIDLGAPIIIGDRVSIGQEVMLLTSSHRLGSRERRCGEITTNPIQIGNGVWLGARSTILPGVTVHDGAVVGAGALVVKDVPPDTMVGGVPAKVIRNLQ